MSGVFGSEVSAGESDLSAEGDLPAFEALKSHLAALLPSGLAIAFSGGLDSRFLAHAALFAAREQGLRLPLLLHVSGPHMARDDTDHARNWARQAGLELRVTPLNPLHVPQVAANARDRCYHCKHALFSALGVTAGDSGCVVLADGSNASDRRAYRPGMRAVSELGVRSPLADVVWMDSAEKRHGLDKPAIHRLAALSGLDDPGQQPRPCLLTRLPYDRPVTESLLRDLETLEARVRLFFGTAPSPDFRLRALDSGFVLHVEPGLSSGRLADLCALLPNVVVEQVDSVSGYFDRCRGE